MKHITMSLLGLMIVTGAGQARAGAAAEGSVTRSEVAASDMDAAISECMRGAAGGWVFPRPEGGALQVEYPFVLEPG